MAASKKPSQTLRNGGLKATIWLNDGAKGPFFSTAFSRSFKDQYGAWHNVYSFGLNDLEALIALARDAKGWIAQRGGMPR